MRKIFIGMLFVFLDFNLDMETVRIGLIPDFIGYVFMVQGLSELVEKSKRFWKVQPFATGMLVYTAILYAMDVFGVSYTMGGFGFVLGLVSTIISLVISYNIVLGVKDMEIAYDQQLNADGLYSVWKLLAVFSIAVYITWVIPTLGILCIIAGLVVGICFLVSFSKTKNLYYSQNEQ